MAICSVILNRSIS